MSAPADLRRLIARDLAPARPLPPPSVRTLALLPIAAAVVASVPLLHSVRPDLPSIGVLRPFGFSIVQAIAGIAIIAAALRESVPHSAVAVGVACFRTSAVAALPALIASAILSARAFPLRPVVAGALYGLGCGLIADAGLRLWCEFSAPSHVLSAHVGAIVLCMLLGAFVSLKLRL